VRMSTATSRKRDDLNAFTAAGIEAFSST
jgi:hypothetical protein